MAYRPQLLTNDKFVNQWIG